MEKELIKLLEEYHLYKWDIAHSVGTMKGLSESINLTDFLSWLKSK